MSRSVTAICLAVSLLLGGGAASVAREPWTPRGAPDADGEQHDPAPAGFVDRPGPAEVDPSGRPRIATPRRTNIVVIMLDDHPQIGRRMWMRLPNIRRLFLEQGISFTRYHGNDPLCCPGRANFLTGLTTDHHGVWTNDAELLEPGTTLATELQDQGYFTIMAGKYLNAGLGSIDLMPPGWSRAAWTNNAYYDYDEYVNGATVHHDDDANDYQPDVAFNRALQFLREAPADRPLFAWVTPFVPHAGTDPARPSWPKYYAPVAPRFRGDARCAGLALWLTPAHADDNSDRPLRQQGRDQLRSGYDLVRTCRAMLAVDAGVGRIAAELKAQGRLRDTVLVLTSDNGMGWGAHGWYFKMVNFATHLPLAIRWPAGRGVTPRDDDTYLSNVDLAATLCEVGGCVLGPYPDGRVASDGTSFVPVMLGTGTVSREALYTQNLARPLWRAIRTTPDSPLGLWHYTEYSTGERELYDASGGQCWEWTEGDPGDPCELTNLAGLPGSAEVEAALHELLAVAVRTGGSAPAFSGTSRGRSRAAERDGR